MMADARDRQAKIDQAAAVEAERKRIAADLAAAEAERKKREENIAHRKMINGEALADIVKAMSEAHSGSSSEASSIAKEIVTAIAKGSIRHVRIVY